MMHALTVLLFVVSVVLTPPAVAAASGEPLALVVPTRIASEPGHVTVRARIENDPRSRELTIEWWTPEGFGGSHLITLVGARSALWHTYAIKGMEAGEYEVAAVLTRSDGSRVKRAVTVTVVGALAGSASSSPFSATR